MHMHMSYWPRAALQEQPHMTHPFNNLYACLEAQASCALNSKPETRLRRTNGIRSVYRRPYTRRAIPKSIEPLAWEAIMDPRKGLWFVFLIGIGEV